MANVADKPMLLIVDDEQNFTESLQLAIEDEFTVSVAGSLESARDSLKRNQPAVILLDLRLPDGDGSELLHEFKQAADVPIVIVMTAYATVESIGRALSKGAVDYFIKPPDISKLKLELKKRIERKAGGNLGGNF